MRGGIPQLLPTPSWRAQGQILILNLYSVYSSQALFLFRRKCSHRQTVVAGEMTLSPSTDFRLPFVFPPKCPISAVRFSGTSGVRVAARRSTYCWRTTESA
jgi:hypothetical protein